ncbi:MAG: hypothetical protein ACRD5J_08330 [Nitrososphaeraceae archaeon]
MPSSSGSASASQRKQRSSVTDNAHSNIIDEERQQYYVDRLLRIGGFNDVFELVKLAVEQKFKMHRAGLSLVLQGLPGNLGAYHVLGSNMIIVNKRILGLIKTIKSTEQYNSFVFTVLTHEYLHSFGIIDELRVRNMTYEICRSLLGEKHPATIMAKYEPWSVFPELGALQNSFDQKFELIKEFDKRSQSYIS